MTNKDFESVIPTAILTAYPRTLTDIPYAKEVFNVLNKDKIPSNLIVDKLAVELEARYKLISKLLEESNINQILELASGYSTRGLDLTVRNDQMSYVELDLPQVGDKKIEILKTFTTIPKNLHVISGNALNKEDVDKCEQYFDEESQIAIANEGLLRYLNFDEKKHVATNIRNLLSKHGGLWITCDATPRKFIANQDANLPDFNKSLSKISDRNNASWRFSNIGHVKEFFDEIGFAIESVHPLSEVKEELTSPKTLDLNARQVDDLLKDAIVVVMKVKER
ncbi:MAG: class I SAM-dependent methyltransferase [Patescibacteria group bacterium]